MNAVRWVAAVCLMAAWFATGALDAQAGGGASDRFTARLAWVPTAGAERVSGKGAATATLSGRTLAINGTFEGLGGSATVARLHEGIAKGARGKAIADLTATKAANGSLSGSVTLSPEQIEALRQGRLYIQLHGDKGLAPDGANLWGWFLR